MAHATDGGGSIRIPAALCGLFGLKPSRGRVSLAPIGETLAGAGAQHCVSISVRDSAALLDAVAGGEPGDPYRAPPPPAPSWRRRSVAPGRLRVAFMRKPVGGDALDPVLVAAVERTARLLEELGHHVEEAAPDYDAAATGAAFGTVMCANTLTNIQVRADGRVPGPDDLEPVTRLHAEQRPQASAPTTTSAPCRPSIAPAGSSAPSSRSYDVLLSPTIARTSPAARHRPHGRHARAIPGRPGADDRLHAVCNATGVPAMSVPLAWTDDGLPIGMHFVGRFGAEEMLFSLAAELERAALARSPATGRSMNGALRTVIVGFVAGALSVLSSISSASGCPTNSAIRATLYNMRGVPPWGVPTIVSSAFWGGCGASPPPSWCRGCPEP